MHVGALFIGIMAAHSRCALIGYLRTDPVLPERGEHQNNLGKRTEPSPSLKIA
jgi:hypothetical protein